MKKHIVNFGYNYSFERLFLSKLISGNLNQVMSLFDKNVKNFIVNNADKYTLAHFKIQSITYLTVISREVIVVGVEPFESIAITNKHITSIENAQTIDDLITTLKNLTIEFCNSVLDLTNIKHYDIILKACEFIDENISSGITLDDVSNHVMLSPNYFSSLFKKEMNIPLTVYINNARIRESQYLLKTTNFSISEISIQVGFSNQNYFTSIFKKTTGVTPKKYRLSSKSRLEKVKTEHGI